ncbi:GAF domain-containing protein [candidate division WOR-3 bacterium]|nr:GAF domain-containing protein [candidate division WOR-3 bacterium]
MLSKQIINSVAQHRDFNNVLKKILDLSQEIIRSEAATLFLIDRKTDELVFQIVNGPTSEKLRGKRIRLGEGIAGKTAISGATLMVNKAKKDSKHSDKFDKKTGFITESLLTAPLIVDNEITGVIELINSRYGGYTEKDRKLIGQFAAQVSSILEIALLSERLARSEEFLNVVINSLPGGLLIVDEEHNIRRANLSSQKMLGRGKIEGLKLEEILPSKALAEKVLSRKYAQGLEATIAMDGKERHLQFNISTAKGMDAFGIEREYTVILVSDVTERVELARLKYTREINSRFLDGISHNLKTPITSIIGLSQLLYEYKSLSEDTRQSVKIINEQGLRMKELVEKLLDIAQINKSKILNTNKRIELIALLREVIKECNPGQIHLPYEDKEYYILGNYKWLYSSLKELFLIGTRDNDSEINVFLSETNGGIAFSINGLNKIVTELLSIKSASVLRFDDPLSEDSGMAHLSLSLVRLILSEHRIEVKLDKENNIITLNFNRA